MAASRPELAKRLALLSKQMTVLCDLNPTLCLKAPVLEYICSCLQQVGPIASRAVTETSFTPLK